MAMSDYVGSSELLDHPEFKNLIRVALGFLEVKKAIGPIIDRELKDFQEKLKKGKGKCQTCEFSIGKGTEKEATKGLCDGCRHWVDSVMEQKTGSQEIYWKHSDLTKWDHTGEHWELAKLFMGSGQKHIHTAADTDCSALLNVLGTCKLFHTKGSLTTCANELKEIRNKACHSPCYKLEKQKATEALNSMHRFLDKKLLDQKVFPKEAFEHAKTEVKELTKMTFFITKDAVCIAVKDIISFRELEVMKKNIETNRQEIEKNRQEIERERQEIKGLKQLLENIEKNCERMVQRQEKQEKETEDLKVRTGDLEVETKDIKFRLAKVEAQAASTSRRTRSASHSSMKRQAERKEKAKTQKQCLSAVSLDDLMKGEEDGVAQVRVLKFRFDRSKHGQNRRYIYLDVGDPSGCALIVAFGEKATELKQILEQPEKPRNLKIKGSIKRITAQAGYEHYAPDGLLVLAKDTEVTIITSDVDCPDPQNIELVQVKQRPAYRSRVALKQALVTEARPFKKHDGQDPLKMALYDGSEGRCTLLEVEVSAESALRKEVASTPIAIQVKEAWIYPFGDRNMLRAKEKDVVVQKNETLTEKWETEKTNVTQDDFEIPCISVKCVDDIRKSCREMKQGDRRLFRINASIQHVHGNDTEINKEDFMYPGCSDDRCQREVKEHRNAFRCPKCKKRCDSPRWRYCLKIKLGNCEEERQLETMNEISTMLDELDLEDVLVSEVGDVAPKKEGGSETYKVGDVAPKKEGGSETYEELKVTAFDGTAVHLMNEKSATDIAELLKAKRGNKKVKDIFEGLLDSEWQLKIQVKIDLKNKQYGPMIMTVEDVELNE